MALSRQTIRQRETATNRPLVAARQDTPAQRSAGPSVGNQRLQNLGRLRIDAPDSPAERQAERVADQVMAGRAVERPATPQPPTVQRLCADCEEELHRSPTPDGATTAAGEIAVRPPPPLGEGGGRGRTATRSRQQREVGGGPSTTPGTLSPTLPQRGRGPDGPSFTASSALAASAEATVRGATGGGQPLPAGERAFFEPRLGADLSDVRVHHGPHAEAAADAVQARAFTVGRNVVFGAGEYRPGSSDGRRLMAHELAHVMQQQGQAPRVQRVLACRGILDATEGTRVRGQAAHEVITTDYVSQVGSGAVRFRVPGASSEPWRNEGCGDVNPSETNPLLYNGRRGYGVPDLAYQDSNGDVEIAEIKIGTWDCYPLADQQVGNYVDKANDWQAEDWRRQRGFGRFRRMPTGRFYPLTPTTVSGQQVTVSWCEDGVIVYKPLRDNDPALYFCGAGSDQGRLDEFLDQFLGRAQAQVDRYLSQVIDPAITQAIETLSVERALRLLYRVGRPELEAWLRQEYGPAAPLLLPSEENVAQLGAWIDEQLGARAERILRDIVTLVKRRILDEVRQRLQDGLRQMLQTGIETLCVTAAVISADMLAERLDEQLRRMWQQLVLEVALDVVVQVARQILADLEALATEIATYIAIAVLVIGAVVLAVVTVAAALEPIPGDEAIPGAALAAVVQLIRTLAAGLARGAPAAGPGLVPLMQR